MRTVPVILDWRPHYMAASDDINSLALAPIGSSTLLCQFHARLAGLPPGGLTVVPGFRAGQQYEKAVRNGCRLVAEVVPPVELRSILGTRDPSDWLLLGDLLSFPTETIDLAPILERLIDDRRCAVHLLSMRTNPDGATERVRFDTRGRVETIQRYYDSRTWLFASGVVCTAVPVSTFLSVQDQFAGCGSLADFRRVLVSRDVPSRDVPLASEALDLGRESHLLRLSEHVAIDLNRAGAVGDRRRRLSPQVHETVRLIGAVALHEGVVIDRGACVIGPAAIGPGARIGANAVVAQCVVGAGVAIPANTAVSQRAVFDSDMENPDHSPNWYLERTTSAPLGVVTNYGQQQQRRIYPSVKTALDRSSALAGLIVLAPLMLIIAALIKLDSRGSVFYADLRETIGGRVFRCWKFRTMRQGAEYQQAKLLAKNQVDGPQFKISGDPRITRVGRVLRKVSLDELPQLFNVVAGQMSLIGPRPSPFRENQICVPWRHARLSVRAGITGLWQVCRHDRRTGDFHQWIDYDMAYVQHLSWLVDLKILLATLLTLGGVGHVPVTWIIPNRRAHGFERRQTGAGARNRVPA